MEDYIEILAFTSYCDPVWEDGCTSKKPCKACVGLSNVFKIPREVFMKYAEWDRELATEWNVEDEGESK